MVDNTLQDVTQGCLAAEIKVFINFKQRSGLAYTSSIIVLNAFNKFCVAKENQSLSPQQLAFAWCKLGEGKPRYNDNCSVRQLGQYLTEIGHPKAFIVLSAKGNAPIPIGVNTGPFAVEIKEFIEYKRQSGKKYISAEHSLKNFDIFCSMKKNISLTSQELANAWCGQAKEEKNNDISAVREFGLFLTLHGSMKSFMIPYANGKMPKPPFVGYNSLFAEGIESFIRLKKSAGLNYKSEVSRLKAFDEFCNEHANLTPQQLADTFLNCQNGRSNEKRKRSNTVIKALGSYLTKSGYLNSFNIVDKNYIVGPYAKEIEIFVEFKRTCGHKYHSSSYHLRGFDIFCASEENKRLTPQQLADKWVLKREGENANSRAGRVGPIRVFGKYLMSIGHPDAFAIANDIAPGTAPKPPYLFSEDDIETFFTACVELEPDEKDPAIQIVLPTAFLFMFCMGVRTCELKILMGNVNFFTGEILIDDSKTGDRIIYMSEELSKFLLNYNSTIEHIFPCRKYLFPASVSRSRNDFAMHFRRIWAASVPTNEHGMPRLYDFRHHLLYRNVELYIQNGGDVNTLRPYIMKHMGHKLPDSFQYYFHLSPPIRKEVSKIKNNLDWMIPNVPKVPYE